MSSFHVLIIGGGFAGLEAARYLARQPDTRVTLVDQQSHALFTPRLVDALAGVLPEQAYHRAHTDIATRHGYTFVQGTITELDAATKRAALSDTTGCEHRIEFDAAVCSFGAHTAFYGLAGQEFVFPLKTWDHLLSLEQRLQQLARITHPRIAIVGGGATGIEAAVALRERLSALGIPTGKCTIDLYQAAPQILPGFLPATVAAAARTLEELGVRLHTNAAVTEARAQSLVLKSGDEHPADLILWAPGIEANHFAHANLPHDDRGALLPDHTLRLSAGVYAGGDVVTLREGQRVIPKNAQTAMKMGAHIAKNILRERAGKRLRSFAYRSPGVMLWLGSTSIVDLLGLSFASPVFTRLRGLFYRYRWWQITG